MTLPRNGTNIDHALELYRSGLGYHEAAKRAGISSTTLHKIARRLGFARPRGLSVTKAGIERRSAIRDRVVQLFESGQSVLAISEEIGTSRTVISACLADAGISTRSGSEANLIRFSRATDAERKAVALAANAARRGRSASMQEMERKAQWKALTKCKVGAGEAELAKMLQDLGVATDPQAPVGKYNIDILCGLVAVEVHSQTGFPHNCVRTRQRIKDLIDAGLHVVYVLGVTGQKPRLVSVDIGAANEVASFVKFADRNPSTPREYRMIARTGELLARACGDLNQLTIEPVPRRSDDIS